MIANNANKENIDEENNALLSLREYFSDEDEMPTGQPKVKKSPIFLQYFFAFSIHSPYLCAILFCF